MQEKGYKITGGGNLNFKNVVHFITPSNCNVLATNLEHLLGVLDKKLKRKSIAIPAIGTGIYAVILKRKSFLSK